MVLTIKELKRRLSLYPDDTFVCVASENEEPGQPLGRVTIERVYTGAWPYSSGVEVDRVDCVIIRCVTR